MQYLIDLIILKVEKTLDTNGETMYGTTVVLMKQTTVD